MAPSTPTFPSQLSHQHTQHGSTLNAVSSKGKKKSKEDGRKLIEQVARGKQISPYAQELDGHGSAERLLEACRQSLTLCIRALEQLVGDRNLFWVVLGQQSDLKQVTNED